MKTKKLLISLLLSFSLISCGESEYVKQLKSDITLIDASIELSNGMLKFYEHKRDSLFKVITLSESRDETISTAYDYVRYQIDLEEHKLKELKAKRHDIELEILKNKGKLDK